MSTCSDGTLKARAITAVAMALVTVLGVPAAPAIAEVIVMSSKGAAVAQGATLPDDATIDLPAGANVSVLLPSGTIRALKGPAKVVVRDLTRGEKAAEGLFDKVGGILKQGGSERQTGAVRSAIGPAARPVFAFSWTEIPVEAEGDICIERGAQLSLVRGSTARAMRMTLVDMGTNTRAEVSFAEGAAKAAWPAQIEAKVGKYALLVPDRALRQIQLRIVDPIPARESAIRVLHGQRCEAQMQALVRELMN